MYQRLVLGLHISMNKQNGEPELHQMQTYNMWKKIPRLVTKLSFTTKFGMLENHLCKLLLAIEIV